MEAASAVKEAANFERSTKRNPSCCGLIGGKQRSFGRGRFQLDWKAGQHAIHRTAAHRHRENDESAGNHRRACSRDIEVAATCPDDEI